MKEPVDHILRPRLPWRSIDEPGITECGYDASKVKTLSRTEFQVRSKEFGRERTYLLTCMTCLQTAQRWSTWEDDPRQAIEREITWETRWRHDKDEIRLRDELLAIAALIEAHRDEFDALLAQQQAQVEERKAREEWVQRKKRGQRVTAH